MKVQTITEQLLFSTVRIKTDAGIGTGFLLQAQLNIGRSLVLLITNKHVVKDAKNIKFFFTKAEEVISIEKNIKKIKFFSKKEGEPKKEIIPKLGESRECLLNRQDWLDHPDTNIDLTLFNLSPLLNKIQQEGETIFIKTISINLIPSQKNLEDLDALEDILFIGYPCGIYDSKNLLPIIRRGITATPIYSNYEGKSMFLIDASVFPGSSGSPVFIYDKTGYRDRLGHTFLGGKERIYFCGVISKTFKRDETGKIRFIEIPTKIEPLVQISQMIDLGIVIKSEKVKELVELYLEYLNKVNKPEK